MEHRRPKAAQPAVVTMARSIFAQPDGPKVWTAIAWILGLLVVSYLHFVEFELPGKAP